jgi:cytochrome c oxidase subunit 2
MSFLLRESRFLWIGGVILTCFAIALVIVSVAGSLRVPGPSGAIDPERVFSTPPFDQPGIRKTGTGAYEAVIIGQVWLFRPDEIRVPVDAEITFTATTADVIHSLYIPGTGVNMTLVPGQITRDTYRFEEPGEYLMVCNEYCGVGHHTMYGKVIVE